MSVAVETFGFFMAALGLLMLGVTLPNSYWRVSTVHGNVITTNTIYENLWYSCATDSLGVSNCWEFPSMLALSGYVQACRALMITAILLGFLGLFLGMLGLRCTSVGGTEPSRKAKLAATAGALHMLAGNRAGVVDLGCRPRCSVPISGAVPDACLTFDTWSPLSLRTPSSSLLPRSLGHPSVVLLQLPP